MIDYDLINFNFNKYGFFISNEILSKNEISKLKKAFYKCLEFCGQLQKKFDIESITKNTIHHIPFFDPIFIKILEKEDFKNVIKIFFNDKKFILNSLGGQNNSGKTNYASKIHRDMRFFSHERLFLNTIWNLDGFNDFNGPTELMVQRKYSKNMPNEKIFNDNKVKLLCPPGSIIYFDSRIWHRAGVPKNKVNERIIFTPIFSRPFIKPGFNYTKLLIENGLDNYSNYIKQIMGFYSDVPETHEEWYDFRNRRFYLTDQDE